MTFDPVLSIQEKNGGAFNFRIEIRVGRHMQPPISAGIVRSRAIMQSFRKRALSQSDDFVLLSNISRTI